MITWHDAIGLAALLTAAAVAYPLVRANLRHGSHARNRYDWWDVVHDDPLPPLPPVIVGEGDPRFGAMSLHDEPVIVWADGVPPVDAWDEAALASLRADALAYEDSGPGQTVSSDPPGPDQIHNEAPGSSGSSWGGLDLASQGGDFAVSEGGGECASVPAPAPDWLDGQLADFYDWLRTQLETT